MTLDQSIQNLYCQMNIIVTDKNNNELFNGSVGELSAQYRGIGQRIVYSSPYVNCAQKSYVVIVQ